MSDFVQREQVTCRFDSADGWAALTPIEQSIKRKIEAVGKPLKDWDINIYRGVLTGCNEAFIINTDKRDEILSNCQSEEERTRTEALIRPILRGRDIKRYGYVDNGLFLINTHNGIRGKFPRINIEDYPAVKAHLDQYWDKIYFRADQGDTPYNLRNCAYLEDFSKPKIIYPETTQKASFAYDESGIYLDKTCFMLISEDKQYLLITLSSSLFEFAYKKIFSSIELSKDGYQYNKHALIELPIVLPTPEIEADLAQLFVKGDLAAVDAYLYRLYCLTEEEQDYIESHQRDSSGLDNSL